MDAQGSGSAMRGLVVEPARLVDHRCVTLLQLGTTLGGVGWRVFFRGYAYARGLTLSSLDHSYQRTEPILDPCPTTCEALRSLNNIEARSVAEERNGAIPSSAHRPNHRPRLSNSCSETHLPVVDVQ